MHKINSRDLLLARAAEFTPYLGNCNEVSAGKVSFPAAPGSPFLSLYGRRSVMSTNYYLSLQTQIRSESDSGVAHKKKPGVCYLNRLGFWSVRGKDSAVKQICDSLKSSSELTGLLRTTDLDSITIRKTEHDLQLTANLYGGGFSTIMLPPMQFKVGISKLQLERSVLLFKTIYSLLMLCNHRNR